MRPLAEPSAIQIEGLRILVEHIGVPRAQYWEIDPRDDDYLVSTGIYAPAVEPFTQRIRFDVCSLYVKQTLLAGQIVVFDDIQADFRLSEVERAFYGAVGLAAIIGVPLIKGGLLVASLCIYDSSPREWTEREIALATEVAERTWEAVERGQAEAALRESEAELRYTIALNPQVTWTTTPDGTADFSSERWADWTGNQGLGGDWLKALHPDDVPFMIENRMQSLRTSEPFDMQHRVRMTGSGAYRWVRSRCYPRRNEQGEVVKWYGTTEDIHDSKLAEQALRQSEERFRQFAVSSTDGLWICDAETLRLEFSNPATETNFGLATGVKLDEVEDWAALIVPEDREQALQHLESAKQGATDVLEYRIQRKSDRAFRWIRDRAFPLRDETGSVRRIGGIASDVTDAKLSVEHQAVLLAELQHRVRNIMAVIRSITARTSERAESVQEFTKLMEGRLLTLARVQALLTRAANVGVAIRTIVLDELSAQSPHQDQHEIDGPDVVLAPKVAEVVTLAVHELTTNALKYGALSISNGRVTVRWATFENRGASWLRFDWVETGAPDRIRLAGPVPHRRGFGSELIEGRIPYELRGRGKLTIELDGARCHLEFPLQEGASILETDAPRRAAVYGGALDMTGEVDLSSHRILVIEDDYYLATDTARALQGAGAEVLGPCPSEDAARDELKDTTPTGAVVDVNLGQGPCFKLARELKASGIPFVFVTGYDQETVPPEFDEVARLQKPVELRKVVGALATALGARS